MQADIYLANKLDRKDSKTGFDEWFITKVANCQLKVTDNSSLSADRKVEKTDDLILLIPFTGKFKKYSEWKNEVEGGYTVRTGDIVFLENPGMVTRDDIIKKHNEMADESFEVKSFTRVKQRFGVRYELRVTG